MGFSLDDRRYFSEKRRIYFQSKQLKADNTTEHNLDSCKQNSKVSPKSILNEKPCLHKKRICYPLFPLRSVRNVVLLCYCYFSFLLLHLFFAFAHRLCLLSFSASLSLTLHSPLPVGSLGVIYVVVFPAFLVISGQLGWTVYESIRGQSSNFQFVVMMCFLASTGEFCSWPENRNSKNWTIR